MLPSPSIFHLPGMYSPPSKNHGRGCAPNPRRPLAGTPSPHSVAGGPRCARPGDGRFHVAVPLHIPPAGDVQSTVQEPWTGLRPKPPPASRGDPIAPLRGHHLLGAAPQTPAGLSRGPHCPTPWPAGRAVRGLGDGRLHVVVPPPYFNAGGVLLLLQLEARRARLGGWTLPCCRPPPYSTCRGCTVHRPRTMDGAAPQTPAGLSRGPRRALSAGRLTGLGATWDFHQGLL